jgi:hypothetical protein
MTRSVLEREYSRYIIMNNEQHGQRTGQYLFNSLPDGAREVVAGTMWDPFHKELSQYQIEDWLANHVVFNDNGTIIGIIAGRRILWGDR